LAVTDVRRVVQKSVPRVRRCAKHAGGKTTVTVAVLVNRKGRVTRASAASPHTGTPLGKCVEKQARRLRFPPFNGSPMRIRLPYAF
jgi:TonB family protein